MENNIEIVDFSVKNIHNILSKNGIGKYREQFFWALNPFHNGLTCKIVKKNGKTVDQQRKESCILEKSWGNSQIKQDNNGNWTTLLGEGMVKTLLRLHGLNPRKPKKIVGCSYEVDWECDSCMVEVKTRNWTTTGTAGEKVLVTMYKCADIPIIYEKPLKIVCIGYQEYELSNCTTRIFNTTSIRQQKFLELAKSFDIEYICFSDLVTGNIQL